MLKNTALINVSKAKYNNSDSFYQNIWASVTCVIALIFYFAPVENILEETVLLILRSILIFLASVSLLGSIYVFFQSRRSLKQVSVTKKDVSALSGKPLTPFVTSPYQSVAYSPVDTKSRTAQLKPTITSSNVIPNERKNFDYSNIDSTVNEIFQSAEKKETTAKTSGTSPYGSIYNKPTSTNLLHQSPQQSMNISSGSGGRSGTSNINAYKSPHQQFQYQQQQQQQGQVVSSPTFLQYYSSPVSEKNSPIPLGDKLMARGKSGIVRTVDALNILLTSGCLSDMSVIDDWIENIKRVLFHHLYETLLRFDESIKIIKQELYSKGVPIDGIKAIENILTFKSETEAVPGGTVGEKMDLEYVIARCRTMQIIYPVQEYLSAYSLFLLRSSSGSGSSVSGISGGVNMIGRRTAMLLPVLKRMRELASDSEKYLRVDFNYRQPTTSTASGTSFQQQSQQQQQQYMSSSYSRPHDADIAIGIFLHMCDTALETSSSSSSLSLNQPATSTLDTGGSGSSSNKNINVTSKFASEHYADNINLIPEPSLPGLSRGIDEVGIVRITNNNSIESGNFNQQQQLSSPFSSPLMMSGTSGGSGMSERPHFNVYIVHDHRPAKKRSASATHDFTSSTSSPSHYRQRGSSGSGFMSGGHSGSGTTAGRRVRSVELWSEGEAGIEMLSVIDGRQNCYEAMIVYLIVFVGGLGCLHDTTSSSTLGTVGGGSFDMSMKMKSLGQQNASFQRLVLDIFQVRDWTELEAMLHINTSSFLSAADSSGRLHQQQPQ